MRVNPFLRFHRAAEAAGYPALLIVSMLCLGLVVTPVSVLALTRAGWALALALLSVIAAVAILAGAVGAAFADYGEPASRDPNPATTPSGREAGRRRRRQSQPRRTRAGTV